MPRKRGASLGHSSSNPYRCGNRWRNLRYSSRALRLSALTTCGRTSGSSRAIRASKVACESGPAGRPPFISTATRSKKRSTAL